ncbi:Gfo/Idh/MocA family oxidoreductase, partial [bacterium]|nr:Gfo/Idh/MocA family oxidoreductase [bacterium]
MKRRSFVKTISAVAGAQTLPLFTITKSAQSANSKLNVAFIGSGGRAGAHVGHIADNENLVAFCDVDQNRASGSYKKAPDAKHFKDFRVMFDKMANEIDAVCICTPDHTHFVATYNAMALGKHVMTEKPLTHNVWQARTLKKAAHYFKVISQMGNQGHATDEIRQVKEWYESGVTGNVHTVLSAFGGPDFGPGKYFNKPKHFPPEKQPVPDHLDWELWRGPVAKDVEYNSIYVPKQWRGFFDFGNGELGDWACHTLDAPYWALELGSPDSVT